MLGLQLGTRTACSIGERKKKKKTDLVLEVICGFGPPII
jgi:hypothetical protein